MNIVPLFISTVYAAEMIVSPLPNDFIPFSDMSLAQIKPVTSFGTLMDDRIVTTLPQVLGETVSTTPSPTPSPTATPPKKETILTRKAAKNSYTVALLGDSMIDTLGPDGGLLKDALKRIYPSVAFTVKNFGVGATNIEYGITRITNAYTYLGNGIPSLVSQNPDVVVIESFGYNPFSFDEGALDKHWLSLAKAVDTVRASLPQAKIVIAATIAPNANVFGDGAPGLSFASEDKWKRVNVIKQYLENAVKFAKSQNLPLADAYHPSLGSDGNGRLNLINPGDHIHYSDAGRAFFSQKIADAISSNKLLE